MRMIIIRICARRANPLLPLYHLRKHIVNTFLKIFFLTLAWIYARSWMRMILILIWRADYTTRPLDGSIRIYTYIQGLFF
jgi:hypothetical protein